MSVTDILVVDDDAGVCRIVQRMLSNEQCKVQTSQSVAGALGAIEQKAFDAYVIDFKLPDGSGLDVAERIRSKWGATPIILISGYDPAAIALRAEKLSISNFLEKPFSREIICEAVKKALASPKAAPKVLPDPPVSAMANKPTKSRFWRFPLKSTPGRGLIKPRALE
jgi:DNA-binding NtrC family response regulator